MGFKAESYPPLNRMIEKIPHHLAVSPHKINRVLPPVNFLVMSKTIKFEKSINEIVEFELTSKERLELVNYILYELTTQKELNKFTEKFIEDYEESKNVEAF